jgi:nitric oxide reductase NorD protein
MAVIEARRQGIEPFCITIDHAGEDYLPHLFGPTGHTVVKRPEELAFRLPRLYAQLTR